MPTFWIALGSNLDAETNLRAAAASLRARFPGVRFSGLYRSPPAEVEAQPEFLNACAVFATDDEPEDVLAGLQEIERKGKKAPPYRFGPRTIDLDLLLADDAVMQGLSVMSKLNADWEFLTHLRDEGRASAGRWLEASFPRLGRESTIDIAGYYL